MPSYKLRANPVDAVQWTGENAKEVTELLDDHLFALGKQLLVSTVTGTRIVNEGEWIVKSPPGTIQVFDNESFNYGFEKAEQ